jgi:surface carbohydrate biosynthesis protein
MNVLTGRPSEGAPAGIDGPAVILVDNKMRDLNVAVLIAHQLELNGVPCYLEPLEAFRAVVGAHRPGMIVFNHLNGGHLVSWSRRLAELGVLTAVLPNEGIIYDQSSREVMAGRFHRDVHVDYFFCWNASHRDALLAEGIYRDTRIEVVGVPRFDFYFKPWSNVLPPPPARRSNRPRVLLCTNFIFAHYQNREEADRLFGTWARYNPAGKDYWGAVQAHRKSRPRVLEFLQALVDDGRFEVVLRPHPGEEHGVYQAWLDGLTEAQRANVVLATTGNISSLILDCDLQISCETCTTAIESWIAKKPTLALIFDKHPIHYKEVHNAPNVSCDNPAALPDMVARHLAEPIAPEKAAARARHLETWCATPSGQSTSRIAARIAEALRNRRLPDWSKLTANDFRRAAKLRAYQGLGQAYHFDPFLWLKSSLFPQRYALKNRTYRKSIMPRDVVETRQRFRQFLEERAP